MTEMWSRFVDLALEARDWEYGNRFLIDRPGVGDDHRCIALSRLVSESTAKAVEEEREAIAKLIENTAAVLRLGADNARPDVDEAVLRKARDGADLLDDVVEKLRSRKESAP